MNSPLLCSFRCSYGVYWHVRAVQWSRLNCVCVYAQVDCAKHLEKTKREIVCKVEKDKSTLSARDEELDAANLALEEAQKRVWAAQKAKRQQTFAAQAHEVLLHPHHLYSACTT